MFECLQLQCYRGDCLLFSELSFKLEEGQLLHLQGHNGSGKTTLMRVLCQLTEPTEGQVLWHKQSIKNNRNYQQDLLYIGHLNAINTDLTALENLQFSLSLSQQKISQDELWKALKDIGLRGREDLPARVLSQGQKRRIALARLLLSKQTLWILDEPFTALDTAAIRLLEGLIEQHIQQGGMVLLTTHQDTHLNVAKINYLKLGWKEENHV